MINSITLEQTRLEGIIPLVAEYKAKVIGLCQTEDSMAETVAKKVTFAGELVEKVSAAGIPLDDLYIDPLVYPIATDTQSAFVTLMAIEKIMEEFPGVHTTCGLTNISYGLPNRKLINRTFLIAAIVRGLDSAIIDPTDRQIYGALRTALMILGKDEFCGDYIKAHREERME
jgi:5-methyltetrahydrofolate--homocysteine methyltransferase